MLIIDTVAPEIARDFKIYIFCFALANLLICESIIIKANIIGIINQLFKIPRPIRASREKTVDKEAPIKSRLIPKESRRSRLINWRKINMKSSFDFLRPLYLFSIIHQIKINKKQISKKFVDSPAILKRKR